VVADGSLTVEVGPATSSLDRVAELVWDLQSGNHGVQKLADRLATIFVPVVLAVALLAAGANLALGNGVTEAMLVGLTVLIVVSVRARARDPARGRCRDPGRARTLHRDLRRHRLRAPLRGADTVVFDKTGTLTTGEMRVVAADLDDGLLRLAAALEERSAHPVGQAIAAVHASDGVLPKTPAPYRIPTPRRPRSPTAGWQSRQSPTIPSPSPTSRVTLAGGLRRRQRRRGRRRAPGPVRRARGRSPTRSAAAVAAARDGGVPVAVGRDGAAEGVVVVGDELREGWEETVTALADSGVEVVVLTGDDERAATVFREHDAIASVFAGVPPEGKRRLSSG